MSKNTLELLPEPKRIRFTEELHVWPRGKIVCRIPEGSCLNAFFEENAERFCIAAAGTPTAVTARIDRSALAGNVDDPDLLDEGYVLEVSDDAVNGTRARFHQNDVKRQTANRPAAIGNLHLPVAVRFTAYCTNIPTFTQKRQTGPASLLLHFTPYLRLRQSQCLSGRP